MVIDKYEIYISNFPCHHAILWKPLVCCTNRKLFISYKLMRRKILKTNSPNSSCRIEQKPKGSLIF